MDNLTVIVAGGSGVFGRHIARALAPAGHRVLGLGRGPGNDIRADLLDRRSVMHAARGHRADVIVHAATALKRPSMSHKGMYPTDDLRTTGTKNLVEMAHAMGAQRFIGENIVFGYGYRDFGDRVLTEDDPFGVTDPDDGFNRHLHAMGEKERLPEVAGLESISLRYGLFYGPGSTETMVELLRKRKMPALAERGRVIPWIHLVDAANAVLAAIERGRAGEAYNIADESRLGLGGMVRATAEAFGTPKPFTAPTWLTGLVPYARRAASLNIKVSCAKAHAELKWKPLYPTVEVGLAYSRGQH